MNYESYLPLVPAITNILITTLEALVELNDYETNGEYQKSEEIIEISRQSLLSIIDVWQNNLTLPDPFVNLLLSTFSNLEKLETHPYEDEFLETLYSLHQTTHYLIYFTENTKIEIDAMNSNSRPIPTDKKKIMFVPYNSSMWDSMDSIHEAAISDCNCEVYIVPAPYFTLNGKRLEKFVYEGYDLPPNVTVTHWLNQEIKEMKFDVIYFHNPYDYYNTITRLHSDFHSPNLRDWCDKLIYTQYAIGIDSFNDLDESRTMFASSTIKYPFSKLIDLFLCNSKIERNFLIEQGYNEEILFQSCPKLDYGKKLSIQKADYPPEWNRKLNGKKVFLLGLNIGQIYAAFAPAIKIIESFVNDNTSALIFRPHPFTAKFLQENNPDMYNHFIAIIDLIKKSTNIIFDDTASYSHSFAVADALFNDVSSIMPPFIMSGKPVYQYIELYRNKKYHLIDFTAAYGESSNTSIDDFKELVINENDYKKEERLSKFYKSIGKNIDYNETDGYKTHRYVIDNLLSK